MDESAVTWHFNIDDPALAADLILRDGVVTRILSGANLMLSIVRIAPHTPSRPHRHPEEQWGILLRGRCIRDQQGAEVEMHPGDLWHTPAGELHGIRTEELPAVVLDVFSPPRPNYLRPGDDDATDLGR